MTFNAAEYAEKMIAGGCDPETAKIVAAKQAKNHKRNLEAVAVESTALVIANIEPEAAEKAEEKTEEPKKKKVKSLTKSDKNLLNAGAVIADSKASGNDLSFMHSIMCQVGLPRSRVDGLEFERTCGGAGIYIRAGKLWDGTKFVQQPVPYGTMPRLIMAYLNTQALRNKSAEVDIGSNINQFLNMLGKSSSGGVNGNTTAVKKQIMALAACNMSIGITTATHAITYDGKPIQQFSSLLSGESESETAWSGSITFSQEYYGTLSNHAVPIDLRALNALASSALAMDVYVMLADRLHRVSGKKPVRLFWANLRQQFGQEYTGPEAHKNFKKAFLEALNKVRVVYPAAKVEQISSGRGGLLLKSSPPPISYKQL